MTIDVDAIRVSGRLWGDNYALLTGYQIIALCDALDAEREKVRVLREAAEETRNLLGEYGPLNREAQWCYDQLSAALTATDDGGGA
jgi:hypothetical protein